MLCLPAGWLLSQAAATCACAAGRRLALPAPQAPCCAPPRRRAGVVARYGGQSGPDGDSSHGPFDLGPLDNLASVCGDNPLAWPFPGRAAAGGDGLSFPSRWDRQQQRKAAELGAAPQ